MGSRLGTLKIAAKRVGLSFEEYTARVNAGLKRCTRCKEWLSRNDYEKDKSRGDGLTAACRACRYTPKTDRVGTRERRLKAAQGLAWCRGCKAWLPKESIRQGACRAHLSEYERTRYAEDELYRRARMQHANARKRGVAPVPPVGIEYLLEEFENCCAYCGGPAQTWDHMLPVSKGGETVSCNIVPACKSCNSRKKDRDLLEFIAKCDSPYLERVIDRALLSYHTGDFGYFDSLD